MSATKDINVDGQLFPCPVTWTVSQARDEIRQHHCLQGGSIHEDGIPILGSEIIGSFRGSLSFGGHQATSALVPTGASSVSNVNTDFVLLWKAIMVDEALVVNGDQWALSCGYWCESTRSLVIRDWWKTLRKKILDDSSGVSLTAPVLVDSLVATDEAPVTGGASKAVNEAAAEVSSGLVPPHMVVLDGKAGRGKSAFLRYLIFSILRDATAFDESSNSTELPQEYMTNPRIAFVDRDKLAYLITTKTILPLTTQQQLMAHKPHYFFADNVDIDNESSCSVVVMGLTSGDTNVLEKYTKRWAEAREKPRSHLFMSSPNLVEMITMFSHVAAKEDITFRFDVVGGNPRLAFDKPVADSCSSCYSLVEHVVNIMFPVPAVVDRIRPQAWAGLQQWAVEVTSGAFDRAIKNKTDASSDSSTFREYVVSENGEKVKEVFSSTFMAMVAARVKESQDAAVFGTLKRLFGSAGMGVYFEYGAQLAFLNASRDTVYECIPSNSKTPLKMKLGGGKVRLIRTIKDLEHLQEGDHAIPTIPNYTIVDGVVYLHGMKVGLQMTIGLHNESAVTKLGQMRQALGIQASQPFTIVFVVPLEHLEDFTFPTNLGNAAMYLTTHHPCAPEVIEQVAKKRKIV